MKLEALALEIANLPLALEVTAVEAVLAASPEVVKALETEDFVYLSDVQDGCCEEDYSLEVRFESEDCSEILILGTYNSDYKFVLSAEYR